MPSRIFYMLYILSSNSSSLTPFPCFCLSVRHPRPGHPGVQSRPAELLHHHQQGHNRQGCGGSHRQWVRPRGRPRNLLPVRGVRQSRGRHKAEAPPRPALQTGWSDSAQRQVRNGGFKHHIQACGSHDVPFEKGSVVVFSHIPPPSYGPPSVPSQLGLYEFFICCQGCLQAAWHVWNYSYALSHACTQAHKGYR